ncbi:uncharacterized protein [Procambarus clarkii]|uniref:uncharacterized protein n=1 Tax=Procambarus clarkii TaxID=6728 RepID=UPI001E677467|nr:uncharacterized protein LOC123760068 [Procambarus clarkii]
MPVPREVILGLHQGKVMSYGALVVFVAWLVGSEALGHQVVSRPSPQDVPMNERTSRWAAAAYDLLQSLSCEAPSWTTEKACLEVQLVPRGLMRVWATQAGPRQYVARLPDGSLQRSGRHDGVLMLDPYPSASWGHLVLVIFVSSNTSLAQCSSNGGYWVEPGDCLTVAVKERCRNLFERRGRRKNYARRCEINLPPLVVRDQDALLHIASSSHGPRLSEGPLQRLTCRDDAPGYAPCARLRPLNDTNHLVCDPLGVNMKRCSSRHDTVHTRCRLFEVCDQAVVLSGGWSRDLSPEDATSTVTAAYHMLRHNGFHKGNIKIFYANGARKDADPALQHAVYPSSMKLGLRYHLRSLCATPLCTDSLVVYLAGPALNDGTILLWDEDRNGLVRGGEAYSPRELLRDLQECAARQVTVLVDTSYAGEIVTAFAKSKKHKNVQVFGAGGSDDYSWGREFSSHWSHYAHTHSCTAHAHQASLSAVRLSTPTSNDGSSGDLRRTIFGAPCNVTPPFTWRELHHRYLGCQNTPTALWIRSVPPNFSPPDPTDIADEVFLPSVDVVE